MARVWLGGVWGPEGSGSDGPGDEAVKELKGRVAMGQHMIDCPPLQVKGVFLNLQST